MLNSFIQYTVMHRKLEEAFNDKIYVSSKKLSF